MATSHKKQYWKSSNKQNRKNIFESVDVFLQSAYEYFSWCDKNDCYKPELIKTGAEKGTIIEVPVLRPYSLSGLCAFWGWSLMALNDFRNNCSTDFKEAIDRIETIIETQHFEGAVTGVFNVSAIGRKQNASEQIAADSVQNNTFGIEVTDNKPNNELDKLTSKLNNAHQ